MEELLKRASAELKARGMHAVEELLALAINSWDGDPDDELNTIEQAAMDAVDTLDGRDNL